MPSVKVSYKIQPFIFGGRTISPIAIAASMSEVDNLTENAWTRHVGPKWALVSYELLGTAKFTVFCFPAGFPERVRIAREQAAFNLLRFLTFFLITLEVLCCSLRGLTNGFHDTTE